MLRGFLLFIFTTLAAAGLAPLVEPFVGNWLKDRGYYEKPSGLLMVALNWLEAIVGQAAFPWVAGGLVGCAVGAWTITLASTADRRRVPKEARFAALHGEIERAKELFWNGLLDEYGNRTFAKVNHSTLIELNALYARLKAVGVKVPTTEGYDDPTRYNLMQFVFLKTVEPYARAGLLKEANRDTAKQLYELTKAQAQTSEA